MHVSVCDYLLDCIENAVEAGAREIRVRLEQGSDTIRAEVQDNGCGMDEATLARATDPFATNGTKHAARRVGLGLPFLVQAVEMTGGEFGIESRPGKGTTVRFAFPAGHIDTPPLGSPADTFLVALEFAGDYELVAERECAGWQRTGRYVVRRSELQEALGDLQDAESLVLLRRFLRSQEEALQDGGEDHGEDDVG